MPAALSNPYEIHLLGIECKVSPYGTGSYIALRDLIALGDKREAFEKALQATYACEYMWTVNREPKELEGVAVYYKKPPVVDVQPAEEKSDEQVRDTDQAKPQGVVAQGLGDIVEQENSSEKA